MTARTRLLLDIMLLGGIVAAYYPRSTGLPLHEWLCLALAVPALVHLVVNWDWVVRVIGRFFGKARAGARVNLVVDVALFVTSVAVMVSGLMVSRVIAGALGFSPVPDLAWLRVHSLSADATIVLALTHFALHWRWVVRVVETRVLSRPTVPGRTPVAVVVSSSGRRHAVADTWPPRNGERRG